MPEVLEPPPQTQTFRTFVPPFSDPEFARQAGLKSAAIAQAKLLERARVYQEAKQAKDPTIAELEIQQQLELSEEQIARTRERLNDDDCGDKERAALLREMRGLMELRLRLRGIGEPGRVRPVQEPARGRRQQVEPIAQPIERLASCASNTPTGCSLESQPTRSAIPSSQEPNG